ncbi:hypothetical protein HYY69_07055 [Candidatus Woesearchaeota archaeon]|nr:hypothetical protein [Candidatus Woesearchaeota archaeon]
MYTLKALGPSTFVLGFRLAGIPVQEAENPLQDFELLFQDKELGIIITDETTIQALPEHFREQVEKRVQPVTVVLSTSTASQETLRKQIQKSIGVDLWKND